MCFLCDGGTVEELHRLIDECIDDPGWFVSGVEPSRHDPMWAYTIGLTASFDHPELVMVDSCCFPCAMTAINALGARIKAGERFGPDDDVIDDELECVMRIGSVHRAEWTTDRFNGWLDYYGTKPWQPPRREAVQVLWRTRGGVWQDDAGNARWPADCLALAPDERPRVLPGNLLPGRSGLDRRTQARWRSESRHERAKRPRHQR
jgi:hypothetical protein